MLYKLFKENKPVDLFNIILTKFSNHNPRNGDKITLFHTKHNFFKNRFFHPLLLNGTSYTLIFEVLLVFSVFKKNLLKVIRPFPNNVFNCQNYKRIKYLTRLCLGLIHLRELNFEHSFQNTLNPFCPCSLDVETNTRFFLYFPLFSNQRCILLRTVNDVDSYLTNTNDSILTHIFLFGKASFDMSAKSLILNSKMNYIISTNRFEESLFHGFVISWYMFISFTLLRILMFFIAFYPHPFSSYVCFYYLLTLLFCFLHSLLVYTQVSLEYLRHLALLIFFHGVHSYNCFLFFL